MVQGEVDLQTTNKQKEASGDDDATRALQCEVREDSILPSPCDPAFVNEQKHNFVAYR